MRRLTLFLLAALALAGCVRFQWGTNPLRRGDVWWSCQDRCRRCSPEKARMTLRQMDGVAKEVVRELCIVEGSHLYSGSELKSLREAIREMEMARLRIGNSPLWKEPLKNYVSKVEHAERVAIGMGPRVYAENPWEGNAEQQLCGKEKKP